MSKIDISVLAKTTQTLPDVSRMKYSHVIKRVVKNGFSEIALYKAVVDHCDENDIKYASMGSDMWTLLQGCAENVFFPKMDNEFSYLRGMYHDLRYGDLNRDEPKCAEQRGLFLCGRCYLIKEDTMRSSKKSDKRSCRMCANDAANAANKRSVAKRIKAVPSNIVSPEEAVQHLPQEESKPMTHVEPVPAATTATFIPASEARIEGIKVKEVMADANGATITIECETASLGEVLMAVQSL